MELFNIKFWGINLMPTLIVGLGGALGAMTRFWIKNWLPQISANHFPASTLMVNLIGCFLAGFVYIWLQKSGQTWSETKSLFFFVGFLGALTTFSAFALDSLVLFNQGESIKLMLNILANCLLCLLCVFLGAWLGGRISAN